MLKKFSSRIIFSLIFIAAFLTAYFFFSAQEIKESAPEPETNYPDFHLLVNKLVSEKDEVLKDGDAIAGVPFTPQAPSAQWDNPVYQDGCEEAAALMAVYWAEGKTLDKNTAENIIAVISDYEEKNYGGYHDTAVEDTAKRIIQGYFGYDNFEVKKDIVIEDIIDQVKNGRLVIAPFDGRSLGNPYYTAPGPERHNLVIRGYDSTKKEFITNDPGTKRGEGYRYNEEILYNALRDYPTGDHQPIVRIEKNIIAVGR
ncbi:MAG: hypothetical protein AUJ11_01805 [Parcubacteria group bacterium CG1_02_44_65]|nr:MAG: hypothetical protein AUJ11_01805 [Parcubacteria group bacterium CG1_02_44_65]PIZ69992.1 MAG: hypothetical protein COY10_00485 [Candidatus Portnoybacteria bacterium CG_4_10_14_0_2_um_filter_43_36]PJA64000.1 MAG: hypothetical protein CO160_00935 [Candidatus Portnoybacteria bacterium CG_4_9_14_3_um_filter_43_11]